MSKGSKRRPENKNKYDEAWEKIFGSKRKKEPKINSLKINEK
tara:strand:- start:639 stop:764 length:126 start_codon:yes stop_codon:yes gene_type:complete